jgi:hypothetical protein
MRRHLERACCPLVRLMAVALAVTVATAAALEAISKPAPMPWFQTVRSVWV